MPNPTRLKVRVPYFYWPVEFRRRDEILSEYLRQMRME